MVDLVALQGTGNKSYSVLKVQFSWINAQKHLILLTTTRLERIGGEGCEGGLWARDAMLRSTAELFILSATKQASRSFTDSAEVRNYGTRSNTFLLIKEKKFARITEFPKSCQAKESLHVTHDFYTPLLYQDNPPTLPFRG